MQPYILPPIVGQTGLFNFGMTTGLGEGKPVKLCLKIDLVLNRGTVEGWVNAYKQKYMRRLLYSQ